MSVCLFEFFPQILIGVLGRTTGIFLGWLKSFNPCRMTFIGKANQNSLIYNKIYIKSKKLIKKSNFDCTFIFYSLNASNRVKLNPNWKTTNLRWLQRVERVVQAAPLAQQARPVRQSLARYWNYNTWCSNKLWNRKIIFKQSNVNLIMNVTKQMFLPEV